MATKKSTAPRHAAIHATGYRVIGCISPWSGVEVEAHLPGCRQITRSKLLTAEQVPASIAEMFAYPWNAGMVRTPRYVGCRDCGAKAMPKAQRPKVQP